MKTLGNILWFIFGGIIYSAVYFITGIILCATIILIPFGIRYIKLAGLALAPFGKTVDGNFEDHPVKNTLWLAFGGISSWIIHGLAGIIFCITIIGIPFAKQHFKLAKFSIRPFGATVEKP